jgi:hypothetical protein
MSLEAWGNDGDADRPYTQERVDEIVSEWKGALIACVAVAKAWHGPDVWDIYYNHSPEMKPIRDLLGPVFACKRCHDSGEVEVMTQHLGPDDYLTTIACPDCGKS